MDPKPRPHDHLSHISHMIFGTQVDRQAQTTHPDKDDHPEHGQLGERDLWQAGGHGLQRPFRMHLLPTPILLQSVWRPRRLPAPRRERA